VVPSIEKIKEIAGEGAVEMQEEYQDVYMCAAVELLGVCQQFF
jgi:hypothetical protein